MVLNPRGTKDFRRYGNRELVPRVECWGFRKSAKSLRNEHELQGKWGL